MALTKTQLKAYENLHNIPINKVICIAKAAIKAYKCIKAAEGNPAKIAACAAALVGDIEACVKGKS